MDEFHGIPEVEITKELADAGEKCPICFDTFQKGDIARMLLCIHFFHESCIKPWIEANSCPVCRQAIRQKTPHHTAFPDGHVISGNEDDLSNSSTTATEIESIEIFDSFIMDEPSQSSSDSASFNTIFTLSPTIELSFSTSTGTSSSTTISDSDSS